MKIIGVIGSRTRCSEEDFLLLVEKFKLIYEEGDWICSGGCSKGGDHFAEIISKEMGIPILIFPANWKRFGKKAGFIRNKDIAKHARVLISLKNLTSPGGAENTVKLFKELNNSEEDLYEI